MIYKHIRLHESKIFGSTRKLINVGCRLGWGNWIAAGHWIRDILFNAYPFKIEKKSNILNPNFKTWPV